jgi:hypothetical protein
MCFRIVGSLRWVQRSGVAHGRWFVFNGKGYNRRDLGHAGHKYAAESTFPAVMLLHRHRTASRLFRLALLGFRKLGEVA